jgi:hypothetical protein
MEEAAVEIAKTTSRKIATPREEGILWRRSMSDIVASALRSSKAAEAWIHATLPGQKAVGFDQVS